MDEGGMAQEGEYIGEAAEVVEAHVRQCVLQVWWEGWLVGWTEWLAGRTATAGGLVRRSILGGLLVLRRRRRRLGRCDLGVRGASFN